MNRDPIKPAAEDPPRDLERERFVFQTRMEEAALALRQREQNLQEARLHQQKAEWERACQITDAETTAQRDREQSESLLRARLARSLVTLVPLFVALVPALWGYAAYLASVRDMARASAANARDTARVNAQTERFKAVLDIKKDFFKHQDKVFEDILRVTSGINREVSHLDDAPGGSDPTEGNAAYQKYEDEFERLYSTASAIVQSDAVSQKMVLFHNGLVFLHHPTTENYAYLNRQRKEGGKNGGASSTDDLPHDKTELLDVLKQELAQSVKKETEERTNPAQYPFLGDTDGANVEQGNKQ